LFKKIYAEVDDIRNLLSSEKRHYVAISLTEGEAFLHPRLCDILEACRDLHPEAIIFVISNGTVPIKGRYRKAVAMIDRLGLSIDGATPKTYEAIRQGADFERFIENVREIGLVRKETGFPRHIGFSFTATRTNLPELPDVVRLAHQLGVDEVYAQPMEMKDPIIEARIRDIHIDTMPPDQVQQHMQSAQAVARTFGVEFNFATALDPDALTNAMGLSGPEGDAEALLEQKVSAELDVRMCQYPWSHPFQLVRDDERYNVLPCCMMTRSAAAVAGRRYGLSYPVSDVKPVMEIYNSEEFWALRHDLAAGGLTDLCGNCTAAKSYGWRIDGK